MRLALAAFLASGGLLAVAQADAAEAPKVVASIKPIHSLVAAVMEGVGTPSLIVDGVGSPHTYAMKPSQAAELEAADLVFWTGDGLEAFLVKPIETLGAKATSIELIEAPGLRRLNYRSGGAFEAHGNEAHASAGSVENDDHREHDDHGHGAYDMHVWLDPVNAKMMVEAIETALSVQDPGNAPRYAANAGRVEARLDALVRKTATDLAAVRGKPFIVFHDAYQYYETRFGVTAAGSITVSPETIPGVKRVSEIQAKLRSLGATCVFTEPQFEPKLIQVVTEGTAARTGVLDPEGAALTNGPNLYFELIDGLTASLKECLAQQS